MYRFNTYNSNNNKYALTSYSNINTSLVCITISNHSIYFTQLLKGRDYVRYIYDIQHIKAIDNCLVILLDIFNYLLLDINCLFRATKPFDNHVNLLLLPSFKHLASILTFVYPSFESILFDLDNKYKSSPGCEARGDIHFKHIYITLSLAAYIHNLAIEISHLLYVKDKLITQEY